MACHTSQGFEDRAYFISRKESNQDAYLFHTVGNAAGWRNNKRGGVRKGVRGLVDRRTGTETIIQNMLRAVLYNGPTVVPG